MGPEALPLIITQAVYMLYARVVAQQYDKACLQTKMELFALHGNVYCVSAHWGMLMCTVGYPFE